MHTATQRLSASVAARVSAGQLLPLRICSSNSPHEPSAYFLLVVTFGDADRDESFGSVAASKILIICHEGDNICDNGIIITPAHGNYEIDAPTAAAFVAARV